MVTITLIGMDPPFKIKKTDAEHKDKSIEVNEPVAG